MEIEAEKRHKDTLDTAESERFAALASEWWSETGKFRALHAITPARIQFIREAAPAPIADIGATLKMRPFAGLSILDIGCGGGLLAEPLARLGGTVTAIDPVPQAIEAAKAHAQARGLAIDYRTGLAEDLAAQGLTYDLVIASEVIEHVADTGMFLSICRALTKPDGLLVISTINRTMRSYALAIVMAERVLGLIPKGTHQWEKFITVPEIEAALDRAGFALDRICGIVLNPMTGDWVLSARDFAVNYILAARRKSG